MSILLIASTSTFITLIKGIHLFIIGFSVFTKTNVVENVEVIKIKECVYVHYFYFPGVWTIKRLILYVYNQDESRAAHSRVEAQLEMNFFYFYITIAQVLTPPYRLIEFSKKTSPKPTLAV